MKEAVTSAKDRLIVAGLYLSKYSGRGLKALGFASFREAYNVLAYALHAKPLTIRGYRDEFDPVLSNLRKGWYKRPMRDHCLAVLKRYGDLDFNTFTYLMIALFDESNLQSDNIESTTASNESSSSAFGQRLLTGMAAETYFEEEYRKIPEFSGYEAENTTRVGCGYDFRLNRLDGEASLP